MLFVVAWNRYGFALTVNLQQNTAYIRIAIITLNSSHVQGPYRAVATALEVIPRTIAFNCGANTIRTLTALRAKHAEGSSASWGVDGMTGKLEDMERLGVLEPMAVKLQGRSSID